MKAKLGFLFVAVLMSFSMAFSAAGSKFYNLYSSGGFGFGMGGWPMGGFGATTLYLEQSTVKCSGSFGGRTCVASVIDTPAELHKLLKDNWANRADRGVYDLRLMSDLDLGEFSSFTAPDKCDINHVPLPFPADTTHFYGDGYTIRNLCYASSTMDKPVGFFESVGLSTVANLKISNVRIVIKGTSTKGEDYYPVGALAGIVSYTSVDTVSIADVYIDAPVAGGIVGYAASTTFRSAKGDDDIEILNTTKISSGFAGSTSMSQSNFGHNVFLGGIVGVMTREKPNASFWNDSLKVVVHNDVATNNAAIGGLAGLYSGYSDSLMNVCIYNKVKTLEPDLKTQIYGGTAMGGFFGVMAPYVAGLSGQETVGNMDFHKSTFSGVISGSNFSGDTVALGGFVGRAIVRASTTLKIRECVSNVEIKDEVKSANAVDVVSYNYYVGGMIGESNQCVNFTKDGDYLSIEKSKTTGSISVAASAQSVSGLHMKSFVGGFVGEGCLSVLKGGTREDSSSVKIDVKVKTAVDSKVMMNGDNAYDSVFVGGLFGSVKSAQAKEFLLTKVVYSGSISIEDSLNYVMAGGLVGNTHTASGGKKVLFRDVTVDPDFYASDFAISPLMTYKSKAVAAVASSNIFRSPKLGGLCGLCSDVTEISRASVKGDFDVTASYGDTLMMGGISGSLRNESETLLMKNVYTLGNLGYSSTAMKSSKVGYLVGDAKLAGYTIKSIYHYGENDLDVGPFGRLFADVDISDIWDDFSSTNRSISFVVRNGESSSVNVSNNGTEPDAYMKKPVFAGLLNSAYDRSQDYAWRADQTNMGLPYFAYGLPATAPSGTGKVYHRVDFVVDGVTIATRTVLEGDDAEPPEDPYKEGYEFKKWNGEFTGVMSDLIVKAEFEVKKFEVYFYGKPNYPDENFPMGKVTYAYVGDAAIAYGGYAFPVDLDESPRYKPFYEKPGFTMVGWADKDGNPDSSYMHVTTNLSFYPRYERNRYAVIYMGRDNHELARDSVPFGMTLALRDSFPWDTVESMVYFKKELSLKSIESMPDSDVVVNVIYDSTRVKYRVVFRDFDGEMIGEPQYVAYGDSAEVPPEPVSPGRVFRKWSNPFYTNVTSNMETKAEYDTAFYKVTFLDYKGKVINVYDFKYGADMSEVKDYPLAREDSASAYDYHFVRWTPEVKTLLEDVTFSPVFDSTLKTFFIVFRDFDGTVLDSIEVEYGADLDTLVKAPAHDGKEFLGWLGDLNNVTSRREIIAQYERASDAPVLSNSLVADFEIKVSGNALRLSYETKNVVPVAKHSVRLVVSNEKDGVVLNAVLKDSLTEKSQKEVLVLRSVPRGEFTATLFVENELVKDSMTVEGVVATQIDGAPSTWRMVALSALQSEKVDWGYNASFYWWDERNPIGEYWQYRSYKGGDVQDSRGFWYGTAEDLPLVLNETSGSENPQKLWKKSLLESESPEYPELKWEMDSLYSGWNMVANPYSWSVSLKDGSTDNDVKVEFWRWNPSKGDYEQPEVIGPYEAVWAKVNKSTSWSVVAKPVFEMDSDAEKTARKAFALRKSLRKASAVHWTLMASLSDEYGKTDSWNAIGVGASAESMEKAPAGMGEYVRLAIAEGRDQLAKSIKPVADEYQWTMNVSANRNRQGHLKFEGVESLRDAGLSLFVTVDGVTQEVTEGKSVSVALTKSSKSVGVRVAPASSMTVASKLSGLRLVQSAGSLQVSFIASEKLAGSTGHFALVDIKGNKIAVGSFTANAGANSISINVPKSGIYFIQVKVGEQMNTIKAVVR